MDRGGCTQIASRRIPGRATGPRHLCVHLGCGLHASGGLSAERTLNSVVDILMRKPRAERHPQPPSSRRSGSRSASSCRSRLRNCASQAQEHGQAKGGVARVAQSSWKHAPACCSHSARPVGQSDLALAEVVALQVERRHPDSFAVPAARAVGASSPSAAHARPRPPAACEAMDGADVGSRSKRILTKTV